MLLLLSVFFAAPPPKVSPLPKEEPKLVGPVLDYLRLFSPEAVARAKHRIAELETEYGYQLVIETRKSQKDMSGHRGWFNSSEREREIIKWVRTQADDAGVKNGLYILITLQPRDVRVVGWPDDAELTFPPYLRQRVREDVRVRLRDNPDGALGAAIDRFAELLLRVKQHSNPLETVPLLAVLGSLAGGWLVLFLVCRRLVGLTGSALYPPALQGCIFGSPAGMWVNDQLFRAEIPAAPVPVSEEAKTV